MDWIKVPLWENDFAIQQDSLVYADTLAFSDSLNFDTIPVLIKPDSFFTKLADSSNILSGDTITSNLIIKLEGVDTQEASKQDSLVPAQRVIQTEAPATSEFLKEDPVFAYDYIPIQADQILFWPRFPFPQEIFSIKDISHKPKQLDFFIYEKKNKSVKATMSKPGNKSDILIHNRNSDNNSGWLLGVFLVIFILLARMKLFFGKYIQPIINSGLSYHATQNLYRNRNSLYYQAGLNLDFIFFLSTGVFVFQLLNYYKVISLTFLPVLFVVIIILLAWLTVRYLVCRLIGLVSLNTTLFDEYFHSILIYNKNIGLFLIPITLGIAYIDPVFNKIFVFIGFGIVLIAYTMRAIRLIRLFISKRISWFYSILYLCALEILPVLLLMKVLFLNK